MYKNDLDISITPGFGIDTITGETEKIEILQCNGLAREKVLEIVDNPHSNNVKKVTSKLAEDLACKLIGCKKVSKKNNKGFDALLCSGEQVEIKIGRIGNAAVIKKNQLEILESNGYYVLIFYRTINNLPPTHIIQKAIDEKMLISPETYLKRNILVESIFVMPRSYIVYYYNSKYVKERLIKSDLRKIKPICQTNALHLFKEVDLGTHEKMFTQKQDGKNIINIYSIGLDIT